MAEKNKQENDIVYENTIFQHAATKKKNTLFL